MHASQQRTSKKVVQYQDDDTEREQKNVYLAQAWADNEFETDGCQSI